MTAHGPEPATGRPLGIGPRPWREIGALGWRFVRDTQFRNVTVDMLHRQVRGRYGGYVTEPETFAFDVSWLVGKRVYLIGGCELVGMSVGLRSLGAATYATFEQGAATDPGQELARLDSAFWDYGADVLVISHASRTGALLERMQADPLACTRASQEADLALLAEELRHAIAAARRVHDGPVFVLTHPIAYRPALGVNEHLSFPDAYSFAEILRLHSLQVYELARELDHVVVIDVDLEAAGQDSTVNYETERANGYYEHFTDDGVQRMIRRIVRQLYALEPAVRRIKCVAVDLDETMWTGVLREDGPDGVKPRSSYQSVLRMLSARGILLAVVSKNDAAEAELLPDLLGQHLVDQLSAVKLGWGAKSAALAELAGELNIGLDSIAFFDDNPRERAEVRQNAPDVLVLSDADLVGSLERPEFQPLGAVTPDGGRRTERYRAGAVRAEAVAASGDLDGFLLESGLQLTVRPPGAGELARVAELAARSNQLNATLARTDLPTLQRWVADGAVVRVASLVDRFGDYGLIGAAVSRPSGSTGPDRRLHELTVSCRAMGRSVEAALVAAMAQQAAAEGAERLVVPFTRGARNAELERILRAIGFEEVAADGDQLELALALPADIALPPWLEVQSR
ncbi:MAG: HAD-superfamily phosphatase, subfamily IIIC/FkbH-like domain [Ilumatobacteraceae bacterium]|nr:HAD-superfamily phosphatase, subfamily IIIC/FkbH-like domain [Ilumatobacteraceae bacterium]